MNQMKIQIIIFFLLFCQTLCLSNSGFHLVGEKWNLAPSFGIGEYNEIHSISLGIDIQKNVSQKQRISFETETIFQRNLYYADINTNWLYYLNQNEVINISILYNDLSTFEKLYFSKLGATIRLYHNVQIIPARQSAIQVKEKPIKQFAAFLGIDCLWGKLRSGYMGDNNLWNEYNQNVKIGFRPHCGTLIRTYYVDFTALVGLEYYYLRHSCKPTELHRLPFGEIEFECNDRSGNAVFISWKNIVFSNIEDLGNINIFQMGIEKSFKL